MNMITPRLPTGFRQHDLELLQHAFDALQRTTGLEGRLVRTRAAGHNGHNADAVVEIIAEGKRHRYVATLKRVDRFATLGIIKHHVEQYDQPGLLIVPYITPEVAERCRDLDLSFIDTVGNVYLHAPGLFVFVKGQRPGREDSLPVATRPRRGTATALRVVFALLCRPELLQAPYREIARTAGVALGAISGVFRDLQERGYLTGVQKGNRRLFEPQRLFEEWVTTYPLILRPKLHPKRLRAAAPDWWQRADVASYGAQWGGEVAAEKLTGYLKPETMTLYIRPEKEGENVTQFIARHRLRADPQGDIELLDTFWDIPAAPEHPEVVPPLLVYADLVATHDPRNLDAARLVYDRKIAHALRSVRSTG